SLGAALPGLVPAPPAIDAGRDEEDLAEGLTQQAVLLGGAEPDAHEDGEQEGVADDADRPGPDEPSHAEDGGQEAEPVADDLAPQDVVASDRERRAEEVVRSEEHTSELQSREKLVCRLLLEK